MAFKVHYASGYANQLGDEATYNFNEAGLLVIHLGTDAGRLTYSPHAWTVVEEPDSNGQYLKGDRFTRE